MFTKLTWCIIYDDRRYGLKSKVLTKVVHVTDDDEICFCDREFSKTCAVRIAGGLSCLETVIRLTPVELSSSEDRLPESITAIDSRLRNVKHSFLKTLDHLKGDKK